MSDCVAFTSERGRERQKETTIKEVDVYGLVIDFVALGCMGPFFLIKTGKDMEACAAAQAKAVEVDGVRVDSR